MLWPVCAEFSARRFFVGRTTESIRLRVEVTLLAAIPSGSGLGTSRSRGYVWAIVGFFCGLGDKNEIATGL